MHLSDTCPSAIQLTDDSYCSAMDEVPLSIEDIWSSMDTASEVIDELLSCTDEKRLAMDAGSINCDTDLVDSTNSLTANSNLIILIQSAVCITGTNRRLTRCYIVSTLWTFDCV